MAVKWYNMKAHYLSTDHQHRLTQCSAEYLHRTDRHMSDQIYLPLYQDLSESAEMLAESCDIMHHDCVRIATDIRQRETNRQEKMSKIEELKRIDKDNEKKLNEIAEIDATIRNTIDTTIRIEEEGKVLILDDNSTVTFPCKLPSTLPLSITSMKFKTSECGYTFLLRLYSTIVQDQTYLSSYLTLCNADYYNLLPFPFSYDIHLMLLDQSNEHKHIKHVLQSDQISSSCTRPTSEYNEEFGIDQFCLLQYLTDPQSIYVRDGIFFMRIFISFLET